MAKKPPVVARAYPEPTGGPVTLGLDKTSHNHSNYPQPNNANNPDPASTAPPGVVPPQSVYTNVPIAGAAPEGSVTVSNPGVTNSGNAGDAASK